MLAFSCQTDDFLLTPTDEIYGSPFRATNIEDFTMYTRPNSQTEFDDEHWFLTGLLWDLYDANPLGPELGDNVRLRNGTNGNNIPMSDNRDELEGDYQPIYDLFDTNTRRASDLENRIISAYPQIRQRTINTFNAYGH